jgi:hypothetical protein
MDRDNDQILALDAHVAPIRWWLDLSCLLLSASIFLSYHLWYYSWRLRSDGFGFGSGGLHVDADGLQYNRLLGDPDAAPGGRRHRSRIDLTGQVAREIWVESVLDTCDAGTGNIAVQTMRNPITAASILATGASLGATTLVNVLLDPDKMAQVRKLGQSDPLSGGSHLVAPEVKIGASCAVMFAAFFSLAQALRLW